MDYESDLNMYEDDQDQQSQSPKDSEIHKKSRGATTGKKMKKINTPMFIDFDDNGRACGKWKDKYSTQVGILGRAVDINIANWKIVPDGLKDTIWLDLQKTFNINDRQKSNVLSHVGSCWRNFKTRLTSMFVYKTKKQNRVVPLDDPLSLYSFISKEQWEKFKKSREDKSFKEKSEAGRAAQKFNMHPHFLGRSGYNGKQEKWLQEEMTSASKMSQSIELSFTNESIASLLSDRSYNWIRAHTPSEGKTIPAQTKELIDEINRWKEKEKEGEFVPNRFEDALALATNKKDHPGRTRGVGSRVRLRAYFGEPKSNGQRGRYYTEEDMRLSEYKIAEKVKKETLAEMETLLEQKALNILQKVGVNTPTRLDSCDLIKPYPFDEGQDPLSCLLGVELESKEYVVVAKGTFWPTTIGVMVNNVPLMADNLKVSIDEILKSNAPLPIPFGGFTSVGEAEGSFGQWPRKWVQIEEEIDDHPNKKCKRVDNINDTKVSGIDTTRETLVPTESYAKMGEKCQKLHDMLKISSKSVELYNVKFPKDLYHYSRDISL
ncbi:hypothetical protein RND81_05G042100 [Saponaria officinalis]|uniref:DUF8039 domain-containing protein n=1 Tax=Saponaria officinalis TaxID=3572 RepID=A0AAW1KXC1_SAPOF